MLICFNKRVTDLAHRIDKRAFVHLMMYRVKTVKGVKNLYLCGQWIMPPGGLPIALFTGKHAAWHVAKKEKARFYRDDRPIKA